jgi:hypothetical protein
VLAPETASFFVRGYRPDGVTAFPKPSRSNSSLGVINRSCSRSKRLAIGFSNQVQNVMRQERLEENRKTSFGANCEFVV